MKYRIKSVFGITVMLLLVGGGCATETASNRTTDKAKSQVEVQYDESVGSGFGFTVEVDTAVDAYLESAAAEDEVLKAEEADIDDVDSIDTEINAYGNVYDKNEF